MDSMNSSNQKIYKIFKLNESDWWAGESLEECIKFAIEESGEDYIHDPRELTEEEIENTWINVEDEEDLYNMREWLQKYIECEYDFPICIASKEW